MVRPCTCLYEIAKKTMMSEKGQALKDVQSRRDAEEIVRAYEHHREKEEKNE